MGLLCVGALVARELSDSQRQGDGHRFPTNKLLNHKFKMKRSSGECRHLGFKNRKCGAFAPTGVAHEQCLDACVHDHGVPQENTVRGGGGRSTDTLGFGWLCHKPTSGGGDQGSMCGAAANMLWRLAFTEARRGVCSNPCGMFDPLGRIPPTRWPSILLFSGERCAPN